MFQRTPSWVFRRPGYLAPFPPQVNWLDRNLPYHTNFVRFQTCVPAPLAGRRFGASVDPDFDDPHAVSPLNKQIRDKRIAFMQSKFGDRPDLMEKMIPCRRRCRSRPVLVDRDYSIYDVLLRDDVTLVTTEIRRVTPTGIELEDGTHVEVDVIVLATGFKANDFLWPMEVRGRDGTRMEDLWAPDGARAYLGAMLPGFPNLFMLYGPNTNQYRAADRRHRGDGHPLRARVHRRADQPGQALGRRHAWTGTGVTTGTSTRPRRSGSTSTPGPTTTTKTSTAARRPTGLWTPGSYGTGSAAPPSLRPAGERPVIDASLLADYHALNPHFGGDLTVQ